MTDSVFLVFWTPDYYNAKCVILHKDRYTEQILPSWPDMALSIAVRFRNTIMRFITWNSDHLSIAIANNKEIISYSNDEYTWSKKCNPIGQYISNNIVFACLVLFNILHNSTNNHVLHFALRLIKLATTRFSCTLSAEMRSNLD